MDDATRTTLTYSDDHLDVTPIIKAFAEDNEADPYYLSGSIMNLGANAASSTWKNSLRVGRAYTIGAEGEAAIRDHFTAYGAWAEDEIAAWDTLDLVGLIVQECAAAVNEIHNWCDRNDADYDDLWEAIKIVQDDPEASEAVSAKIYMTDDLSVSLDLGN
jgi:hypothetical protein